MKTQKIFRRYELKYLMTLEQKRVLEQVMADHMHPDEHEEDLVCSIYYDTPDHLLIRRSIEKPVYKEKLRLRFYGEEADDAHTFVELKKKYRKVVYKRRLTLEEYRERTGSPQIAKEIDYFFAHYDPLAPAALVTYERDAWFSNTDPNFRMTFDRNIRYRTFGEDLPAGQIRFRVDKDRGGKLLQPDTCLLEVKTALGMPRWLLDFLNGNALYKTAFSKYGNGYRGLFAEERRAA